MGLEAGLLEILFRTPALGREGVIRCRLSPAARALGGGVAGEQLSETTQATGKQS